MTKQLATSFAFAAASLFLAGCDKGGENATQAPDAGADPTAKVKCMGVNECKGQGACNTATHDCAGQNECKGKGWIVIPRSDCTEKGGSEV